MLGATIYQIHMNCGKVYNVKTKGEKEENFFEELINGEKLPSALFEISENVWINLSQISCIEVETKLIDW